MKKLIRRARGGDDEAFSKLFQSEADKLWKCALSVLHNEGQAADALQETAIKAWRSIPGFDGKSSISTWLTRILINTCYDILRSEKEIAPLDEAILADEPSFSDKDVSSALLSMDVETAMGKLKSQERLILTLFYVNDLSIKDIANIFDISQGATKTRLARARMRFKDIYEKDSTPQGTMRPLPKKGKSSSDTVCTEDSRSSHSRNSIRPIFAEATL